MSEVTKPILLDETGQSIVSKLDEIKLAINESGQPAGEPIKIRIITAPTKTEYAVGDTLDLTGIVVAAVFSNNIMFDVTEQCTFSPADGSTLAITDTEVTVSWVWHATPQTFTATQALTVYPCKIVEWSSGTDAEIAAMLEAHYDPDVDFDVRDFWNVNDERVIHFDQMTIGRSGREETIPEQDVTFVLMNEGGKMLEDGTTECAFIAGMKEAERRYGSMQWTNPIPSGDTYLCWRNCDMRNWLNTTFRSAIHSSTMRGLFKKHLNVEAEGEATSNYDITEDYFAFASEKEIYGTVTYANATVEALNSQFKYYETSANRIKQALYPSFYTSNWGTRSPNNEDLQDDYFVEVIDDGSERISDAWGANYGGISAFGVI